MAASRQATSREDDSQLHTHVVISAKVQTADGRWCALDARYLKRKQRALGGLYQSVLRAELTHRYGLRWGPIAKGQAEIVGMPRELLAAFSKRTRQVDPLLALKLGEFREREGRDPTRWERAALTREAAEDSRDKKTGSAASVLSSRWSDEAAALGWSPEQVRSSMRTAARAAPVAHPTLTVADVIEALSAGASTWTRNDVVHAVCDVAPPVSQLSGHDWARTIERACDQVIESCVALDPPTTGAVRESDGRSIWLPPSEPTSPTSTSSPRKSASSPSPSRPTTAPRLPRPPSTDREWTSSRPMPPLPSLTTTRSCSWSGPPAPARPARCAAP